MKDNIDILNLFAKGISLKNKLEMLLSAVVYTRVSSKEQMDNNKSLEWQRTACDKFAQDKGYVVRGYFGGTYESAKSDERKEFNRMLKFVKAQKGENKISYIIVYSLDRFSRTGDSAIFISSELKKIGVNILSTTQYMDTDTHSGAFQQNIHFVFNKYDNDIRKQKSIDGMTAKLNRGEWLGNCPKGYSYTPNSKQQTIIIDSNGPHIKHAFKMRAAGHSYNEISAYLKKKGIVAFKQFLSKIFKNPFYIGYLSHNFLKGEVVKGNHPPLISEELFLQVNRSRRVREPKNNKADNNLPLKGFVRHYETDEAFTGYIVKSKGLYYYKVNKIGVGVNRSQKMMHKKFCELLSEFSSSSAYVAPLKRQLMLTWDLLNDNKVGEKISLAKKKKDIEDKIYSLEKRHALGDIDRDIFTKFHTEFKTEARKIEDAIEEHAYNLSNPSELINFAMQLSLKASSTWDVGDFYQKQRLQKLIFPAGIWFDAKNNEYRTTEINPIFSLIRQLSRDLEGPKKGTFHTSVEKSPSVSRRRLELPRLSTYAPQAYLYTIPTPGHVYFRHQPKQTLE
jgi:site-specific DNA recombinase